jgi:hypothetical protein
VGELEDCGECWRRYWETLCLKYLVQYVFSFQVRHGDADGQSVRYCLITEGTVQGTDPARYYSRGQKHVFHNELEHENRQGEPAAASIEETETEIEEEGLRATG